MLDDPTKLEEFDRRGRGRLLLLDPGPRALPRQRLPPARLDLARLPRDPGRRSARSTSSTLPPVIRELAEEERGIVLLTGTTGSGKSTTLAAMIDHINQTMRDAHRHDRGPDRVPAPRQAARSSTSARSAWTPASFKRALRRVLRQDPDVILDRRDARRGDGAHRAVARPRPATSCSRRSTPSTPPRRSTASSTSSRRTSSSRRAR